MVGLIVIKIHVKLETTLHCDTIPDDFQTEITY